MSKIDLKSQEKDDLTKCPFSIFFSIESNFELFFEIPCMNYVNLIKNIENSTEVSLSLHQKSLHQTSLIKRKRNVIWVFYIFEILDVTERGHRQK